MPGITGIIGPAAAALAPDVISVMVRAMVHESHYCSGSHRDSALGVVAGWSLLQRPFADAIPTWNADRTTCLLLAGEAFISSSEHDQLAVDTPPCASNEASLVLRAYEKYGVDAFSRLDGTFSGLILDHRQRRAILFNDRYGLARIYYHESADAFYFSAEAKSLLRVLPHTRQFDPAGLGEYLSCGCPLQGRTLFAGLKLLPPASAWIFSGDGRNERRQYFSPADWERQESLPVEEYYEQLRDTFKRIVPKYFGGGQTVSLSLTGGLDSRMVIAAASHPPGNLPCYSVRGMYRECADARLGREIAAACGHPHTTIKVGREFLAQFRELAEKTIYCTDGALDAIGAPGLLANRLARTVAPVRMTGNYGGEVLRSLVGFRPARRPPWYLAPELLPHHQAAAETFAAEQTGPTKSFILFKQVPWHHYGRFAMESSQLTIRSPFLDQELVRLSYRAPNDLETNRILNYRLVGDCKPALAGFPTDRGETHRPWWIPLSAWNWWKEFLPRVEYACDYGMPPALARWERLVSPLHLDRLFLGIQKYYHFRTWYRHELAPVVREVLLDPEHLRRPYLNPSAVQARVIGHVRGTDNCTLEIHKLFALEFITRRLFAAP